MTMVGRAEKLNALRHLAMTMGEPPLIPIFSFLAGRLDNIHFVRDIEGAKVWIKLSGNLRLWPRMPFRAEIDGASIQNSITFIDIASLRDDDIFIQVDLGTELPQWYTDVLEDEPVQPKDRLQASAEKIRQQTDLALDAYRVAGDLFSEADEEERVYLSFVLDRAKEDMRRLNSELAKLEAELAKVRED